MTRQPSSAETQATRLHRVPSPDGILTRRQRDQLQRRKNRIAASALAVALAAGLGGAAYATGVIPGKASQAPKISGEHPPVIPGLSGDSSVSTKPPVQLHPQPANTNRPPATTRQEAVPAQPAAAPAAETATPATAPAPESAPAAASPTAPAAPASRPSGDHDPTVNAAGSGGAVFPSQTPDQSDAPASTGGTAPIVIGS